jgi:hypothetical protein
LNRIPKIHSRHPFVFAVQQALCIAKVPKEVFKYWIDKVRHGFASANFLELPINSLPADLSWLRSVDPRSLFETYNNLTNCYNSLHMQKMALEDDVSRLGQDVNSLIRSQTLQEKTIANQNELLARIANVLEVKFDSSIRSQQQ